MVEKSPEATKLIERTKKGRSNDEFSAKKWDIEDLRALASLTVGGDFSSVGRAAISKRLHEEKINASIYSEQVIAAHRSALAKAKPKKTTSDDEEESEEEIDGTPIATDNQELNSLKAQVAALQLQAQLQSKAVPAPTNPPAPGNDPSSADRTVRIEKIAQDYEVPKAAVLKASEGNYTEVWELSRYSVHRQSSATALNTTGSAGF